MYELYGALEIIPEICNFFFSPAIIGPEYFTLKSNFHFRRTFLPTKQQTFPICVKMMKNYKMHAVTNISYARNKQIVLNQYLSSVRLSAQPF